MDLITNDWKHLHRTEASQKSLLKFFCYNNKVTRKVKDFKKLSNKEIFTSKPSVFTIVLNATNLSNSFHGQTSFKNTIFSVLISGVKLLWLIGEMLCWIAATYIFSIWYKLIYFSLPVNLTLHTQNGQCAKYSVSQT